MAGAQAVSTERGPKSELLKRAWNAFDRGDFDAARETLEEAVRIDPSDLEAVEALQQIYIEQSRWGSAVQLLSETIERMESEWSPREQFPWRMELFDAAKHVESEERLAELGAALFESAAAGGEDLWAPLISGERRAALESLLARAGPAIPLLEQWLYAPEGTGLRTEAIARIEAIGAGFGADRQTVRAAERLLHAAGEREAAYRVERTHREMNTAHETPREKDESRSARGLDLTLVGGHPALRSLSRRDLMADGAKNIREIPSAWEGARVERSIVATLSGSDLAVVIARQVAHTTSDQVRKVGNRIGVPIEVAHAASVGSIRRAVERFSGGHPRP
jgi:hypothetical protein